LEQPVSAPLKRRTVIYIVRVWAEYLSEQPPRWCGVIETVGIEHKLHFSQLDEIADFIRKQTNIQINVEDKQ
jgi:hypothetical protein